MPDNSFGDDVPAPVDADGRRVAGHQDFGIVRIADGHTPPNYYDHTPTDAELDVDTAGNIHRA